MDASRVAKGIKKGLREVPAGSELDFFAASSFKGLGASEEMQAALQGLGIQTPSHVQAAAFKVSRPAGLCSGSPGCSTHLYQGLFWHTPSLNSAGPHFMLHPLCCSSFPYLQRFFTPVYNV